MDRRNEGQGLCKPGAQIMICIIIICIPLDRRSDCHEAATQHGGSNREGIKPSGHDNFPVP